MLKRHLFPLRVAKLMVQGLRLVATFGGNSRARGVLKRKVGKIHIKAYGTHNVPYGISRLHAHPGIAATALAAVFLVGKVAAPRAEPQTLAVLHSSTGSSVVADGKSPQAGLVMDTAGNLYGTTLVGGASGHGTVFKLDTSHHETVLHSFTNSGGDGALPYAGLVIDAQGNLYGTTEKGGALGSGTVFKLDRSDERPCCTASRTPGAMEAFPWQVW